MSAIRIAGSGRRGAQAAARAWSRVITIERRYHVPTRMSLSRFGLSKASLGGMAGHFRTVNSLLTLALSSRLGEFFRNELLDALRIVDQQKIDPLSGRFMGGRRWASAQFMPSTYLPMR